MASSSDDVPFISGSFFESVPADCDLYMTSHIAHDWREEQCPTIPANCGHASRRIIIESVLPENNTSNPGKLLDIRRLILA